MTGTSLIPSERIERTIYLIRGEKVMLDRDLAELYGVHAKALKQAVKRNIDRFPEDFMSVRVWGLEVTICDLQIRPHGTSLSADGVY